MKKVISYGLLAILLISAGFAVWANRAISDADHEFVIRPGSSLHSASQQIADAGVPVSPLLFEILARISGQGARLKAGTYNANASLSPSGLLDKIVRGEFVQFSFTLIEGTTFHQMRASILQNPNLQHDTANWTDQQIMAKISTEYSEPEGLFFPDTYLFPKGSSDLDVYKRTYNQLQSRLKVAWDTRDQQSTSIKTPYEALILASLIEKETGNKVDRPMVAAVFVNRLRKGMLLQTDPTVIYGLGERYQGKLHKSDLQTDTPYNTYTRAGLPPTPIALVGLESLMAAVNPTHTQALYFVSRGDGTSQFSTDLSAHNVAVNRYIK